MTEPQQDRVEINWVQVSASALAAVSSAVLLSTVGVAGTIIGAAVGSVVATAGSAIYSYYLRITRERVAQAQAAALDRVARAPAGASGVWADTRRAEARQHARSCCASQRQAEQGRRRARRRRARARRRPRGGRGPDLARGPRRPALEADRGGRRGDLRDRDAGDRLLRAGHRPGRVELYPRLRLRHPYVDPGLGHHKPATKPTPPRRASRPAPRRLSDDGGVVPAPRRRASPRRPPRRPRPLPP